MNFAWILYFAYNLYQNSFRVVWYYDRFCEVCLKQAELFIYVFRMWTDYRTPAVEKLTMSIFCFCVKRIIISMTFALLIQEKKK